MSMWNSVWNLENPLQKRTICWRKFMVMSVYLILKFLSGLKGLKKERKRSEMISAQVVPAHQKQMLTSKKSVKLFDSRRLSIWIVAELINIDKETVRQILHNNFNVKSVFEGGAETPHSWTRGNSNEHFCWHSSKRWKRPKLFREHNNLWRIMVFFNMTQKVSANPCTGRAPVHQGKRKHGRANPNLKQWWLFFQHPRDCLHGLGAWKSDH